MPKDQGRQIGPSAFFMDLMENFAFESGHVHA